MMLAETFLKEFGRLAAGTDGIRKLRELVLNLAISGRLSDQRPEDGHAQALVEAAGKAIRSAVTSGKIRKPKYFGKAKNSTLATSIPANWISTSLGDLGLISPRNEAPDEAAAGFVPMAEIEAKFGLPHGFEERKWADIKSGYTHVANGDVVLAKITPCFENGKSAAITGLPNDLGAGTTELHVFRQLAHVVEEDYVLAFLKSESFIQAGVPKMTGTAGQKRIPADYFALSSFPLPPLPEQQRIVAKVNELMALCDELEARQAEETGLKRAAAASALHHLTETKTPEETADRWSLLALRFGELFDDLETIKALRVAVIDAAANGAFSTPSERAQFTQGTVDDVLVSSNSGWSPRCDNVLATGDEWGVLKVSAVTWGVFKPEENKRLPSNMEPRPQHALGAGDILVSRANTAELVGRGVKVPEDYPRLMLSDKIVRLVLSDAVQSDYFLLAFHASPVRAYFAKVATGTSDSMRNITRSHIKAAPIALPSLAEQKRIVVRVDEVMSLCDRLEERVREGERLNAELMAALVHSLTETDPDGGGTAEPASLAEDASAITAPKLANGNAPETPETNSTFAPSKSGTTAPGLALSVDTKFQEAVLVAAIVSTFFQAGGEPIGNFRLQKAVYFARRQMGEHVGEMAYLKKAAGPYNPSMKYSGGIAIAKQKNWLREARGRFGFGHVPGPNVGDASEWIDTYGYEAPARWVAEHFRYKKNEEWETLATTDYAIEHLQTFGIEVGAAQILQYIASDPEWRPKIEKLRLTEMSVATAMLEVQALFSAEGRDDSV
ncbi:hypothetical protein DSD19_16035 [Rhodovulum sp. BSW8]|uniref:restriction endonuclease subunit S n=1 Tax=Rhodovulum sp. BSW8 TaxID=2259645 RepID=UPI000DE304C3|nr:restriction endonuclease subunit S [Rhodovulum sp. BSW8]RBO52155.1 hypothetical protein DSD19_16035 [Rhodovulum sp. BSW8]